MAFVDRLNSVVKLRSVTILWINNLQGRIFGEYEYNYKMMAFCSCRPFVWLSRMGLNVTPRVLLLIPNLVSLTRFLVVPIFWLGWVLDAPRLFYPVVYLLLMSLDLIDGPIARQCGLVSPLGKALDPLADKVSHLSILLVAVSFSLVPIWLLIVLFLKEMALFSFAESCRETGAKWFGKLGTVSEAIVLLGAFIFTIPMWIFVVLAVSQVAILLAYAISAKNN